MRLHRITLRDYRGVRERTVELGDGVTVVEGPNEVGKSSLAEALDLLFRVRATSGAREVHAVQPVGRDVGPRVEVEFTTGPYHCTYAKQWLRDTATTLVVHAPVREQESGRAAHDRVVALLEETLDAGLWALLRVEQGAGLAQAQLLDSDALAVALDRAAEAGSDPAEGGRLAEQAREAFLALHTEGRGARRRDSLRAQQQADETRAALDQARAALADAEGTVARRAAVDDELAARAATVPALEVERDAAAAAVEELAALRASVEAATTALARADELAAAAVGAVEARERLAERSAALVGQLDASRAAAARQQQEREDLDATVAELADALTAGEAQRDAAAAVVEQLEARAAAERDRERHTALRRRVGRARALQAQLDALRPVLAAGGPDADALRRLTTAERALDLARARHEQAAATLTLTALTELELSGDVPSDALGTLPAGTSVTVTGDGTRVVRLGEVAELRLAPGADHATTAAAVTDAEASLAAALDACGAATPQRARERAAQREEAAQQAGRLRVDLERELDGSTAAQLAAREAELEERLAAAPAVVADVPAEPSLWAEDDLAEELATARAALQRSSAASAARRTEHTQATARRAGVAEALASSRTRVESQQDEAGRVTTELDHARATTDDDALRAAALRAQAAAGAAKRALREHRSALDGADLPRREELLQRAELRLAAARRATQQLRADRDRLDGAIEQQRARGLAEEVGVLEGDLDHHEHEARRVDRHAAAAALLHTTLERHRTAARRAWVEPLRDEVLELGRHVFGDDLDVELDDGLRIVTRTLAGDTVPFADLSVGAREQLGLVARLAAARLVDDDDGVPVLLDDVLGFADPERLARMRHLLGHVGRDAQVVVLTCDAARFADVADARVLSLR